MSINRLAGSLFLATTVACTARGPASVPPHADATGPIADRVSFLAATAGRSRARLDSAVLELHRASGDTSRLAADRSLQLRRRVRSLDSTYRADLSEFLWTLGASTAGVISPSARFPIHPAPVPLLRGFADGANWMVQSPMIHEIGKNTPYLVVVPMGFVTDLASIPQPLQILRGRQPNTGRYANAAVVHDYLYWRQDCTRLQADKIMAIAMMEAGVPTLERRLVYEAVRRFGQSAWDGNRKARQEGLIRTVAPPHDQVPLTGTWAEYRVWLRAARVREGREYHVPQSVCTMADSLRIPD